MKGTPLEVWSVVPENAYSLDGSGHQFWKRV